MAKVFGSTGRTLGRTGSRNKGVFRTDFRGFCYRLGASPTGWTSVFMRFPDFQGRDQGTNQRFGSNQKQTLLKMKHIHIIEELLSTNPLTLCPLEQTHQVLAKFGLDEEGGFGGPSQAPMEEKTLGEATPSVDI